MTQPKRVPMAEARASLRDLVDDVNRGPERIKLTRYDKTIAGIVSADDLRVLEDCKRAIADCEEAKLAKPKKRPAPELKRAIRRRSK
jgi:hypothetical protein